MEGGTAVEEIEYWKSVVVDLKQKLSEADLTTCVVGLQQQLHIANVKLHDEVNAHFSTLTKLTSEIETLEAENKKLKAHLTALQTLKEI